MSVLWRSALLLLAVLLADCGGGDGSQQPAPSGASVPSGMIGTAGGTVTGPAGAQVVIPAGALTQNTAIAVSQSSAGAPALPAGVVTYGQTFAFTPHGTTFSSPATLTAPFDPASVPAGTTPVLYKTNAAQSDWEVVTGATVSGGTMSAQVTSFSYVLVGSPPTPPKPVLTDVQRHWTFFGDTKSGRTDTDPPDGRFHELASGVLDAERSFGPLIYAPPKTIRDTEKRIAKTRAYSNETGLTYSVSAVAPHSGADPSPQDPWVGSGVLMGQTQHFEKTQANALLRYVITDILIEAVSANVVPPSDCKPSGSPPTWCLQGNVAKVWMVFNARRFDPVAREFKSFLLLATEVSLAGWQYNWEPHVKGVHGVAGFIDKSFFDITLDALEENNAVHSTIHLKSPVPINVPIEDFPIGTVLEVETVVSAVATNSMQGESYYSAYFRDPAGADGMSVEFAGLVQIPAPPEAFALPVVPPAPACTTGTQAEAGTLEFTQAAFDGLELNEAPVAVSRIGGSEGEVSVVVSTADGSAGAGTDYSTLTELVKFADGESGTQTVMVPIIGDVLPEANETVHLSLTDLRGCAALGAQSAAVMTIHDDDTPPARYTIGGTVSGLIGAGLELSNSSSSMSAVNGPFTFPIDFADGSAYDLRIAKQPTNPVQICAVAHGSGTINGANVTNIEVSCAAPQPAGGLDANFGSGGKVAANDPLGAKSMALQADGKLVILSERSRLTRFNADGTPDLGFGTNGGVTVSFNNAGDTPRGLALQSDGKIVVVGRALAGTFDDFGVARYNGDGSLDTSFGNNGKLSIDINGSNDDAGVAMVQADGRIVVAGNGGTATQLGVDSDFAVVRLTSDGALDGTFGVGGKAHTNIAGRADLVNTAILQSDGKVILAGRVGVDGGALPDTGLVRFNADGTLDMQFGNGVGTGIVRIDLSASGRDYDEAESLALDANGKIVLAVVTQNASVYRHTLARLNGAGTLDDSFGTLGIATQSFAAGGDFARAVAIQPDGRIVAVGSTRPSTSFTDDFLITRHNPDGSLDATFATGGKLIIDFFGSADGAECVALQPDGKIIAAGLARNATTNGLAIIRLVP